MLQTIIIGLFITVVGGLIVGLTLYHFFGVGKPDSEKKITARRVPKNSSAPIGAKSDDYTPRPANKDPEAIVYRLKQEKNALVKERIAETYVKLPISWELILSTVTRDKNKKNQRLIILKTMYTASYVTCWIDLDKFPDIKTANEGTTVLLEGTISDIDNYAQISISKSKIKVLSNK